MSKAHNAWKYLQCVKILKCQMASEMLLSFVSFASSQFLKCLILFMIFWSQVSPNNCHGSQEQIQKRLVACNKKVFIMYNNYLPYWHALIGNEQIEIQIFQMTTSSSRVSLLINVACIFLDIIGNMSVYEIRDTTTLSWRRSYISRILLCILTWNW